MKEPLVKKSSLTFMRPFQKGESVGLLVTWDKSFRMQVFVMEDLLPHAIFIDQFEKPFA
jgi:hypothetical protein